MDDPIKPPLALILFQRIKELSKELQASFLNFFPIWASLQSPICERGNLIMFGIKLPLFFALFSEMIKLNQIFV